MAATVTVYDFLSNESSTKWKGLLQSALRRVQKQVHPRLEIDDDAVAYLEELIYRLLAQMCAAKPHSLADVESYVQQNFTAPIDTWALNEAKELMEKLAQKKKSVFAFPVDKIFQQLQKDVFGYKIELFLVQYIMAILDYVSADILKLAGNFVKNTRKPAIYIIPTDIKVSMSADPALQALFQPLQAGQSLVKDIMISHPINESESSNERRSLSYDELFRELMEEEVHYIRHLNLILKVFREPFLRRPDLFPPPDVVTIFGNLQELHELSVQLLGFLEECVEMAGEMEEKCPQAGFVFEDVAESEEFEVYSMYAGNYLDAITTLEEMLSDADVVQYFKSQETKLFKEAMQYILPKSLLEPIYHCFYYFEVMNALMKTSPSYEDQVALESALGCMLALKMDMERQCARFLPKRKEDSGMFGKRPGYQVSLRKMALLQKKIEGWDGPDIFSCCTEFIMEGTLGLIRREGGRRSQKTERHVFLLDGLAVCCKQKRGGVGEYRLKEKINMRKVKLVDMEEADDLRFAFQLMEQDQSGVIFYTISKPEKNEWMAALTMLLTRSTFDRLLDAKLREEELTIPVLRPHPEEYKFAEEDSDANIMFDDPEGKSPSYGPGTLIKAGTIYKLVERLTYHEYADPTLVRTFLTTYRSFCKPTELLNLLVQRFHIPVPLDMDDSDIRRDPLMMKALKKFKAVYVSPIQLRVLNVLRHWVEFHYYDFVRDPQLLEKLKQFVSTIKSRNVQKWVSSIHRTLQKKEDENQPSSAKPVFDKDPEPVEWHLTRSKDEYHILTLHPVEFARQLTLIQSEYFRAIHASELVDASWMKEEQKEMASPHLLRLNRFETTVSNWLTKEIVFTENFDERVALVSRLVDIMVTLRQLNNFAGMFAINAAFESSSVFRLKSTFQKLDQKRLQILDDIKQIASSDKGYKNYKEKLRSINPPCVPFLGMYMTWIVFIRDGNENKIPGKPDHFINFRKRRKIADVLQEIQQYQNSPYCLTPENSVQEYILSQESVGSMTRDQWANFVFEQSRLIEPKDLPIKKATRKYKFDLRPPQDPSKLSAWGTLFPRKHRQHAPIPTSLQDGVQDQETSSPGETSPGLQKESTSVPSSPTPTSFTSPFSSQQNGVHSLVGRSNTVPSSYPARPPKPPKMRNQLNSVSEFLPPVPPHPTSEPNNLPPLPPRPSKSGYGKPPPPLPDAPPLPPRNLPPLPARREKPSPPLPPPLKPSPPLPPPPKPSQPLPPPLPPRGTR